MLRVIYDHIKRGTKQDVLDDESPKSRKKFYVLNLRTYLTHFATYLKSYDASAASLFAGRTKSNVDHRPMHEHLEPIVEKAERGEDWLA